MKSDVPELEGVGARKCATKFLVRGIGLAAVAVLAVGLVACTSTVASWDGGVQNSGLIGKDGPGNFLITEHARERYNGLIGRYGRCYVPPLK
jgi:hypothetical protein